MPSTSSSPAARRPARLYFFGDSRSVERALQHGEFQLRPSGPSVPAGLLPQARQILPFSPRPTLANTGFLTLSLSTSIDSTQPHQAADCCIEIHDTEQFGERLHRAVGKTLPQWAGIDASVAYGAPSPLGSAFTKSREMAAQKEWLFAWRPIAPLSSLNPVLVQMGSLATCATLHTP